MVRRIPVGTVLGVRCFAELPCGAYVNDGFARWRFDTVDGDTVHVVCETCDDSVSYDVPVYISDLGEFVMVCRFGVYTVLFPKYFRQP